MLKLSITVVDYYRVHHIENTQCTMYDLLESMCISNGHWTINELIVTLGVSQWAKLPIEQSVGVYFWQDGTVFW